MASKPQATLADPVHPRMDQKVRPGDFVTPVAGYPTIYQILRLETDGLMRVRGQNWPSGYSALVAISDMRPISTLLAREPL
jgi:hypothetical protein